MKRILLVVVALFAVVSTTSAQSLGDLLKSGATQLIDKVTGGKATEFLLAGTWTYAEPAIHLDGEQELANIAGNALSQSLSTKMQKAYNYVGIKPGSCSFSFNEDKSFNAVIGKRTLSGTYVFDPETHAIELHFSTLIDLGAMKGYAFVEGETLKLVFNCTRLTTFVKTLGAKISLLNGITTMLNNYDNVMLGFGFKR